MASHGEAQVLEDASERRFERINHLYVPELCITRFVMNPHHPWQFRETSVAVRISNLGYAPAEQFLLRWRPFREHEGITQRIDTLGAFKSLEWAYSFNYDKIGEATSILTIEQLLDDSGASEMILEDKNALCVMNLEYYYDEYLNKAEGL